MRLPSIISAVLVSALLATWLGGQYQDALTQVRSSQLGRLSAPISPPLLAPDGIPPDSPCNSGQLYADREYRLYLCVPDARWMEAGHQPYRWVRLVPDPNY